ncbi:hydroxymyristoyl-ACP dehydratase [Pseudolysobacter antarcticus]|uniref:Hydroxymyristoyl-ACP dehydratase n=1 Tax=Pseudolysobacter antarcticus TaxID=2511995 RepID=A0A411HPM4_9GAMM|nr:hydroxymyristoyl-ACP dehydratase [Pseudolysobacter antarcticus]QBB72451.1 hydroxymyristoyl-ACP dehydratase [Pseudolysobacter antarcticus]
MPIDTALNPASVFRDTIKIAADHPSLPGHFPQQPVVPGVVLLDQVAAALQRWRGLQIEQLVQVKFVQPLLPDQSADLLLESRAERFVFEIRRDTQLIASGLIMASLPDLESAT